MPFTDNYGAIIYTLLIKSRHFRWPLLTSRPSSHHATPYFDRPKRTPFIFAPVRPWFTASMLSISEVILLIKTPQEAFYPINGTPGDDHMVLFWENILNTCLYVHF